MANEELKQQNLDKALETAYKCFLEHGVEFVTREMISKQSGISRASLSRYWDNKTTCVLQTVGWFRAQMHERLNQFFSKKDTANKSGLELLAYFMEWCRDIYCDDPRNYVLLSELKVYLYRNGLSLEDAQSQLVSALGFHPVVKRIYELGVKDGSISLNFELDEEVVFWGDAFLGYLSTLALREQTEDICLCNEIDHYINRVLFLYRSPGNELILSAHPSCSAD